MLLKQIPVPVYATPATAHVVRESGVGNAVWKTFEAGQVFRIGEVEVEAFAIQHDRHFLTVLRYVERNALRANLVKQAEDWTWGSLNWRSRATAPLRLAACPVPLPEDWADLVNAPHTEQELAALRNSVNRQSPFGCPEWVASTAATLGLEQSLAPLGRPARRM